VTTAARRRNPFAVAALHLVPFYGLFWIHRLNKELRDEGRALGDEELAGTKPVATTLAVLPGVLLLVPAWVAYYRTGRRVLRLQRLAEVPQQDRIVPWVVLVNVMLATVFILPAFYTFGFLQHQANRVWRRYEDGAVRAGG
jgi:hypothetical protein